MIPVLLLAPLILVLAPAGPGRDDPHPPPARPDRQGVLVLTPRLGAYDGRDLAVDHLGGQLRWSGAAEGRATWVAAIPRGGAYQVVVEYALTAPGGESGATLRLRAAESTRRAFAAPTGSRERFLPQPLIDPIPLARGLVRVTLDVPELSRGARLDVRAVRLIPADP